MGEHTSTGTPATTVGLARDHSASSSARSMLASLPGGTIVQCNSTPTAPGLDIGGMCWLYACSATGSNG